MGIQLSVHSWDLGGPGRTSLDGSSLLENPYIPYQCMGWLYSEHRLKFSLDVKYGAPNNASPQTKNYEITLLFWG